MSLTNGQVICQVCPHACKLALGQVGACRARGNVDGEGGPLGYGRVTSVAVDPVEKKPLARWKPGHTVLSLGSFGCNLHCPWCQNHEISQVGEQGVRWQEASPEDVAALATRLHAEDPRMAGVAYTYNEPLVSWEFVRDCAELVHKAGLSNVLVSAGCVNEQVIAEVAPFIDAANIDLKTFSEKTYRTCAGELATVQATIRTLAATPSCHLEVTTLVVPGVNDTPEEMGALAAWLASVDPQIVLHVSRFHPAYRMRDRGPTAVPLVYELANVARTHLAHVYTGNC